VVALRLAWPVVSRLAATRESPTLRLLLLAAPVLAARVSRSLRAVGARVS